MVVSHVCKSDPLPNTSSFPRERPPVAGKECHLEAEGPPGSSAVLLGLVTLPSAL